MPDCSGLMADLARIVERPGGWLLLLAPMVGFVWLVFQAMPPRPICKRARRAADRDAVAPARKVRVS